MRIIFSSLLVLATLLCFSQKKTNPDSVVWDPPKVDKVPEFKGGDTAMIRFISKNVVYPAIAKEEGVQGIVYLTFIVERNGTISNIKALKGVNVDYSKAKHEEEKEVLKKAAQSLIDESIRVIKLMPPFTPGERYGTQVRVKYLLPIKFSLQ